MVIKLKALETNVFIVDINYVDDDKIYLGTCNDIPGFFIQGDTPDDVIKESKLILPDLFEVDSNLPKISDVEFEFNIIEE